MYVLDIQSTYKQKSMALEGAQGNDTDKLFSDFYPGVLYETGFLSFLIIQIDFDVHHLPIICPLS